MRKLILLPLLLGAAACDFGGGTGSDAAVINVRVVDDSGAPISRIPVRVMLTPSAETLSARTEGDGTARVGVSGAGTYRVTVIPRAGYVGGASPLARNVEVSGSGRTTVDFTIYREGVTGEPIGIPLPPL